MDKSQLVIMIANMLVRLNTNLVVLINEEAEIDKEFLDFMMGRVNIPCGIWTVERHGKRFKNNEACNAIGQEMMAQSRERNDSLKKMVASTRKMEEDFCKYIKILKDQQQNISK